ncbi:MAG: phosphoribosyl-ATP diphosphatase [Amphiplicatus sp.]
MTEKRESLGEVLNRLIAAIAARRGADPAQSYTASLLARGAEACARKFGEEAVETVIAGVAGDKAALAEEAADALYHLLVLLAAGKVSADDVATVLAGREKQSGHAEKAGRRKG